PVDLVIVGLPAAAVPDALRQCVAKRAGAAVVFSSGFAEIGEQGRALQDEVSRIAREGGLLLCGPNTLGFMNTFDRVLATFSQAGDYELQSGPVGFVTQSGAFGTAIYALARERGLGIGYFINSGNEAGVEFADLLEYVAHDPRVRVVAGYIEGVRDGRRLMQACRTAMACGKPVVIVKVGRFGAGARAASSHTGSLAGSDRIYTSVFRQLGVLRAAQEEELLDLATAFCLCDPAQGRRVALITQSGGAGVLMADRAEEIGLEVPALSPQTSAALREVIPVFGSTKNPVDITAQFIADPAMLESSIGLVLDDPGVDAGVFYLGLMERHVETVVGRLRSVAKNATKPFVVAWAAAPAAARHTLMESGICMLPSATRAVTAVRALAAYGEARARRVRADDAPREPAPERRAVWPSARTFELLGRYRVPLPPWRVVTSAEDAVMEAEALGYPVALKIESVDIPHKTEAGGVRLGLSCAADVAAAYEGILASARARAPSAKISGALVQRMASGGVELIAGIHRDETFGPLVMVGLGGVFVEVMEDVSFRAAPLTREDAAEMLFELKGARVFDGVRGGLRYDRQALVALLLALSDLALDQEGGLLELDLNPVRLFPEGDGLLALDALAVGGDS
ncbi:MAG: acetate--CoA ligase family protein, partial [bacterium]|nr:acetate--CoA ligase family protein [bacterium]